MKNVMLILRLVVGVLFVFSGLVKLNDPLGTAIKLEEYFDVFSLDFWSGFHAFVPYVVPMSVAFCVAEVALGVAVLLQYQMKITMWFMLGLIIFFTFLTFYSAAYNKVTDCGCFGDFIKLKPWESFFKDVALTIMTSILFARRRQMPNLMGKPSRHITMAAVGFIGLFVGVRAIEHLPFADWRAYHIGANLPVYMQPSEKLLYENKYTFTKDGKEVVLDSFPSDSTYKYVNGSYVQTLLNPEAVPRIGGDFRIWNNEVDNFTDSALHGVKLFVIVQQPIGIERYQYPADFLQPKALAAYTAADLAPVAALIRNAEKDKGEPPIAPYLLTSLDGQSFEAFRHQTQLPGTYFYIDGKVGKTIMRAPIGVWLLKDGQVLGKWSLMDCPDAGLVRKLVSEN